jgi:protein KRI1
VGDLPTRFKYAPVTSDTYGLSPTEILRAQDAELNAYVGLRQFAPYREGKKRWDGQRPERLGEFRSALAARGVVVEKRVREAEDGERPAKKRKGKKERLRERAAAHTEIANGEEGKDA